VPQDLTVVLQDHPGTLADLGEALGKAGVNIEGIAGFEVRGEGVVHMLVEDAAAARQALEGAGVEVRGASEVLLVDLQDRPGQLGEIARKIANAAANITVGYLSTKMQLVLVVDDVGKARAAL
jgi:hypothetical protein